MPDEYPKFIQKYFIGDEEKQVNIICNYNHDQQKSIVANTKSSLETLLNEKNLVIK